MEVKVTTSKRDELRTFVRKHKKGLAITGAFIGYGIVYSVTKKKPELNEDGKNFLTEFLDEVLRIGEGAEHVYTGKYGNCMKVSDIGKLGEKIMLANKSLTPDSEVVGVVVYTK